MPKWRPLTWVILIWNALMALWLVTGILNVAGSESCEGEVFREACEEGEAIGASIGIGFILFIAAMGNVILGVIYFVTSRSQPPAPSTATRTCPHCAEKIQPGAKVCRFCGRELDAEPVPADHCQNCGAPPSRPPTARCVACGAPR